jgi:hypothetical protein
MYGGRAISLTYCRRMGCARSSRSHWGKVAVVEESATPNSQPCEIAAPPFIWRQSTCCDGCSFHSNLAPLCVSIACLSRSFGQCCVTPATKIQCTSRDYKTLPWPRALVLWPHVYKRSLFRSRVNSEKKKTFHCALSAAIVLVGEPSVGGRRKLFVWVVCFWSIFPAAVLYEAPSLHLRDRWRRWECAVLTKLSLQATRGLQESAVITVLGFSWDASPKLHAVRLFFSPTSPCVCCEYTVITWPKGKSSITHLP